VAWCRCSKQGGRCRGKASTRCRSIRSCGCGCPGWAMSRRRSARSCRRSGPSRAIRDSSPSCSGTTGTRRYCTGGRGRRGAAAERLADPGGCRGVIGISHRQPAAAGHVDEPLHRRRCLREPHQREPTRDRGLDERTIHDRLRAGAVGRCDRLARERPGLSRGDQQVVGGRLLRALATPLRQQATVLQRLLDCLEETGPALRGRVEPGERLHLRQPHRRLGSERVARREQHSRGGAVDPAGEALEQCHPEVGLEVMDLLGEGGLRDVETPGGARESVLLGDADEIAKVAQLHLAPLVIFDVLYYTTIANERWFWTARYPRNPSCSTSPRRRRCCTSAQCRCAAGPTPAGCPASAWAGGGSGASAAPICWRCWSGAASSCGRPRPLGTCAGCTRVWRRGSDGPRPFWRRGWRQVARAFSRR